MRGLFQNNLFSALPGRVEEVTLEGEKYRKIILVSQEN
jgi:hypothetical protein